MTAVAAWHLHARVGGSNGVPVAHCLLCYNGRKTLQQLCKDQIATQSVTLATMEPIISWFRVQDKQDIACARRIHGSTAQSAWFHFTCTPSNSVILAFETDNCPLPGKHCREIPRICWSVWSLCSVAELDLYEWRQCCHRHCFIKSKNSYFNIYVWFYCSIKAP